MLLFIMIFILDIVLLIYGINKKKKLLITISFVIMIILICIFAKSIFNIFFNKVQLPYEIYKGVD